jgi:peptidase inhibitor I78 family protein
MRTPIFIVALASLGACTIAQSDATATGPSPGICDSDALAQFSGQPASQDLGERMLTASGARVLRWVPRGGVVTMDFRGDRITVQLDASNRVERASCG